MLGMESVGAFCLSVWPGQSLALTSPVRDGGQSAARWCGFHVLPVAVGRHSKVPRRSPGADGSHLCAPRVGVGAGEHLTPGQFLSLLTSSLGSSTAQPVFSHLRASLLSGRLPVGVGVYWKQPRLVLIRQPGLPVLPGGSRRHQPGPLSARGLPWPAGSAGWSMVLCTKRL